MRERRQVPRYVCELKGQLVRPDSLSGPDVKVSTLSVKGACIEGGPPLELGQICGLKVEWSNKSLRAEGEVAWTDDRGRAGLKFLPLGEETQILLKELCSTLKLQPIQPPKPMPTRPKTQYE